MVLTPPQPELAHLDEEYQRICAAFDRGELTAADAREQVAALRHMDEYGRVWTIDTKKSGKHASFRLEGGDEPAALAPTTLNPDLVPLDLQYQFICAEFDRGAITASEARGMVKALRHVDNAGRTWTIDTAKSGKHAAFKMEEPADAADELDEIVEVEQFDDSQMNYTAPLRRPVSKEQSQRTLKVALILGLAIILLFAGMRYVIGATWGSVSGESSDSNEIFIPEGAVQTVPYETVVTTPQSGPLTKVEAYGTRDEVPFNIDIEFGRSVMNEPLIVHRRGTVGAPRVLVVGTIHGDEPAGLEVTAILRTMRLEDPVDLWIVDNLNPDGFKAGTRQNANQVDLNRNFPRRWEPVGKVGYWQYSGPSAGSEPETKAMARLGELINPQFTVWYHQDYFRITPGSGRDGAIRERYANLVNLPLLTITGGSYSGTSNIWARSVSPSDGISMTVEFGPSPLRPGEAAANASAVFTIVREFYLNQ